MSSSEAEFSAEIDAWIFGIENYPGEVSRFIVHRIIRELAGAIQTAIQHELDFDLAKMSVKFSQAARHLIHENEVATAIVAQFPSPCSLNPDQQQFAKKILEHAQLSMVSLQTSLWAQWNDDGLPDLTDVEDPFRD